MGARRGRTSESLERYIVAGNAAWKDYDVSVRMWTYDDDSVGHGVPLRRQEQPLPLLDGPAISGLANYSVSGTYLPYDHLNTYYLLKAGGVERSLVLNEGDDVHDIVHAPEPVTDDEIAPPPHPGTLAGRRNNRRSGNRHRKFSEVSTVEDRGQSGKR